MIKLLLLDGDLLTYRTAAATKGLRLDLAKKTLDSTIMQIADRLKCRDGIFFLSGAKQYRRQMSSTSNGEVYKGNRKTDPPPYRQALNDYLVSDYDAVVLDGIEADDGMGIMQCYALDRYRDMHTCIVTNDKDLDQIPGWHYNYPKKNLYWVTQAQADHFLQVQLITGDVADNVHGIRGMGPKKAEKYITTGADIKDLYSCPIQYERNLILLKILRELPPQEYLGKESYRNLRNTLDSCTSLLTRKLVGNT